MLIVLLDVNGEEIKLDYLVQLEKIQSKEGLRAGTKITERHINWTKQKMKVNLAAQTFSSSVADTLQFYRDDLNLASFAECGATVRFIHIIDRIFDLMNSRNPLAKAVVQWN